jgi:hypothetical protein
MKIALLDGGRGNPVPRELTGDASGVGRVASEYDTRGGHRHEFGDEANPVGALD